MQEYIIFFRSLTLFLVCSFLSTISSFTFGPLVVQELPLQFCFRLFVQFIYIYQQSFFGLFVITTYMQSSQVKTLVGFYNLIHVQVKRQTECYIPQLCSLSCRLLTPVNLIALVVIVLHLPAKKR